MLEMSTIENPCCTKGTTSSRFEAKQGTCHAFDLCKRNGFSLALIGKPKHPRCFPKNINDLPVHHYKQTAAWMDMRIFSDRFHKKFVPEVKQHLREQNLPEKDVLLIDNAPSHPSDFELKSADGNFIAKFLSPNVTALIQPMDQGVIAALKKYYRGELSDTFQTI